VATDFGRQSLSIAKRDFFLLVTNVATGAVIARSLGPTGAGVWAIFQLILSYAEALGRLKTDQASVYFVGQRRYDLETVISVLNVIAIVSSAVLIIAGLIWFDNLYALLFKNAPDVRALVWLLLLQIPLQFLYLNYAYLHIARSDIRTYNRMVVVRAVVYSITSVVLLVVLRAEILGVVLAAILGVLCGLVYGAVRLHREARLLFRWEWPLFKDLVGYGGHLYAAGAVAQLNNQLTGFLTALYLVPAHIAFFSIAAARRDVVNIVPNAVGVVLYPRLSGIRDAGDAANFTARTVRTLVPVMIATGLAAGLLAEPAVVLLYGQQFLPVVEPFLLLLPGIVIAGAVSPFNQYFMGIGRPGLVTATAIPAVVAQLFLGLWLVPVYGIAGAALAMLGSLVLGAVVSVVAFLRISRLTFRDIVVTRRDDAATLWNLLRREASRYREPA